MPESPAGYSDTPLAKKLGLKAGLTACVENAPADYLSLLAPLPEDITWIARPTKTTDFVHLFTDLASHLTKRLDHFRKTLPDTAMVWVSWPKKASKVPTDITEDIIREVALTMGYVDVKVCAIDAIWSGLKLVVRKSLRVETKTSRR